MYQFNGGTAVSIINSVQTFNMPALLRSIAATSCISPATIVAYASPPEGKAAAATTSLTIAKPTGLVPGNLMLAAVAVDNGVAASMTAPAGWTLVNRLQGGSAISTGVWWKIAGASEASNYAFSWTSNQKAYGWIMRFSGVESAGPINASASAASSSSTSSPPSPSVTTTVPNAMIVRIGGFDRDVVNIDNAGVSGHTTLTADECDTSSSAASGAAAYVLQPAAGASGSASFGLQSGEEYVTFTLALTPDDGV
jgi:hypothetical protein